MATFRALPLASVDERRKRPCWRHAAPHGLQHLVHVLADEGVGFPGLVQEDFDRAVQLLVHALLQVGEQVP